MKVKPDDEEEERKKRTYKYTHTLNYENFHSPLCQAEQLKQVKIEKRRQIPADQEGESGIRGDSVIERRMGCRVFLLEENTHIYALRGRGFVGRASSFLFLA